MKIGILALQGAFAEHAQMLEKLGIESVELRNLKNFQQHYSDLSGLILLAKEITSQKESHFGTMDIVVERNAYGRQLGSFYTEADCKGVGKIPMTFIRGPIISSVGKKVNILATVNNKIVAAQEKNMLVTSFHPELTNNLSLHKYFIDICKVA